jgi:hypothetical protein
MDRPSLLCVYDMQVSFLPILLQKSKIDQPGMSQRLHHFSAPLGRSVVDFG